MTVSDGLPYGYKMKTIQFQSIVLGKSSIPEANIVYLMWLKPLILKIKSTIITCW